MDIREAINIRKSIRKYKKKQISDEVINELLDAARKAPSAKNVQSHKYFIVKDGVVKNKLIKAGAFKQSYVNDAPLIIICCADPSQYPKSTDVDETPVNYAYIDLSIATSFLVLRATELGLGTVFVAWIYRDKIKEVLNIPENYIIPFVIPVGYPDEDPRPKPRKDLKEIII
ncbi:MAG: nitroreductase family protein [Patescibacteria group bacterium]|nr:nitroreductase family protein [Patescibacteria group bacterium]